MKHITNILSTFALLFLGVILTACKKNMESYETKKVRYSATPSAPDGYESLILSGSYVGGAIIPTLPVGNAGLYPDCVPRADHRYEQTRFFEIETHDNQSLESGSSDCRSIGRNNVCHLITNKENGNG